MTSGCDWAALIFKVCDRLKKLPHEVSKMTLREINTFIEVLPYQQVEERAWELNIHGGKGKEYKERCLMELEYKEDADFDKAIEKFEDNRGLKTNG